MVHIDFDINTKRIIIASLAVGLFATGAAVTKDKWFPYAEEVVDDIFKSPAVMKIANAFDNTGITGWISDLGQISKTAGISWSDLIPDDLFTTTRTHDESIGEKAAKNGRKKKDAVILVPGIISTGLESWTTDDHKDAVNFRSRIWAGISMIKWVLSDKERWINILTLDPKTGLDRPPYRVRAAQGLDAASNFIPGYWLWSKLIENLAVLDYDFTDMALASYDWRLSYYNLEVRDKFFSGLKYRIEFNKNVLGRKTSIVGHSMGSNVVYWFMKWVESPDYGNGGDRWCEEHISNFINLAGPMLGVPKAYGSVLSGEMSDTVNLNPVGAFLLEKYFDRLERADLFRSWPGISSMLPKGGDIIWGNKTSAPDQLAESNTTWGNMLHFRPPEYIKEKPHPMSGKVDGNFSSIHDTNKTMAQALEFLIQETPNSFGTMIRTNFSNGYESDPTILANNIHDHTKFINPLETMLPYAPSMNIVCLYGVGVDTERAFFYRHTKGSKSKDLVYQYGDNATDSYVWMDPDAILPDNSLTYRKGVYFSDGDGTVSLLSLGGMCSKGWKMPRYNPGNSKVITRELPSKPILIDPRGGPNASDHVNLLGNYNMISDVIDIVTGHVDEMNDRIYSNISEIVNRIDWDASPSAYDSND